MRVAVPREPSLPAPPPKATGPEPLPAGRAVAALDEPSPFTRLLHGIGGEIARGEALVRGAVSGSAGGTMDAASLIALQAGVYRYSEVVDLAAKLVDHTTSSLRTVLQGQ